jgi:hypothetical protein
MPETDPKRVRSVLRGVLETQIRNGDPPETREAFDRIVASGIPVSEAWRLLSVVLMCELFDVLKNERTFDLERYVNMLKALPKVPVELVEEEE